MEQDKTKTTEARIGVGSVVTLRSGGPAMTVLSYSQDPGGRVVCAWFDACRYERAEFHPAVLDPVATFRGSSMTASDTAEVAYPACSRCGRTSCWRRVLSFDLEVAITCAAIEQPRTTP